MKMDIQNKTLSICTCFLMVSSILLMRVTQSAASTVTAVPVGNLVSDAGKAVEGVALIEKELLFADLIWVLRNNDHSAQAEKILNAAVVTVNMGRAIGSENVLKQHIRKTFPRTGEQLLEFVSCYGHSLGKVEGSEAERHMEPGYIKDSSYPKGSKMSEQGFISATSIRSQCMSSLAMSTALTEPEGIADPVAAR